MVKSKVSRLNWIEAGLVFFTNSGEKGINVEGIAKSLGCSKGSFYYYFKHRDLFIKEVINLWVERHTLFPKSIENSDVAWTYLNEMFVLKPKDDFLFHLRYYADEYPIYKNILNVIEKKLILKIKRILKEITNHSEEVDKSEVVYNYLLGWNERHKKTKLSNAELETMLKDELMKIL